MADASYPATPVSDPNQPSTLWNTAFNQGYNNAVGTGNPYSGQVLGGYDLGQGYILGQQSYRNNMPATQPTQPTEPTQPTQPSGPSQDQLINSVYEPTMSYLNQAESTIQSQQPGVEADINAQYGTSRQSLEGENTSGQQKLAGAQVGVGKTKEDAASAARRLYSELSAGGRQRFGGSSSAGQAYSELNNVQQQRNQGDIQKQYSGAMQQIEGYKQDLQLKFTSALAELETQKNTAINEAKRYFQDKMLEISRLKGEAESNKASAKLAELQNLRNTVNQINMQDYQYKQQLAANNQTSMQTVEQARQQLMQNVTGGQNVEQAYNPQVTNQLAMGAPTSATSSVLTGRINPEEYYGYAGSRKQETYA